MGYDGRAWKVVGGVSRHNARRDHDDDEAWAALTDELVAVTRKPQYRHVVALADAAAEAGERVYGPPDCDLCLDQRDIAVLRPDGPHVVPCPQCAGEP